MTTKVYDKVNDIVHKMNAIIKIIEEYGITEELNKYYELSQKLYADMEKLDKELAQKAQIVGFLSFLMSEKKIIIEKRKEPR